MPMGRTLPSHAVGRAHRRRERGPGGHTRVHGRARARRPAGALRVPGSGASDAEQVEVVDLKRGGIAN